jgi:alkylation response protein AidB-like acyl-CoA dehydrogenase
MINRTDSELCSLLRHFSTEEPSQLVARDEAGQFDRAGWQRLGTLGMLGLLAPPAYGGAGLSPGRCVERLFALGYGCHDNGLLFAAGAHQWGCIMPLLALANPGQKAAWLPGLCSGEQIGGLAITEAEAGSDVFALRTQAVAVDGGYRLTGHKTMITNAPLADGLLVVAVTDPALGRFGLSAFWVDCHAPGVTVAPLAKSGLRTVPMGAVTLEECFVPIERRVGVAGAGMALFHAAMEWERGLILAPAVGTMERQLERCVAYSRERRQFGRPIGEHQAVAHRLAEMKLRATQARLLVEHFAARKAAGSGAMLEAAMTKVAVSEAWVDSSRSAMQLHGGYGYLAGHWAERDLRDAQGSLAYSGTSDIQRNLIAGLL